MTTRTEIDQLRAQLKALVEWSDAEAKATKMWMYQTLHIESVVSDLLRVIEARQQQEPVDTHVDSPPSDAVPATPDATAGK